jgi:DNA invertase Pin-like site-specific DNA recombinase
MKAVIYARYSSDSQTENSIEGQIRECKAFAERNGITILNSYIDRAFSAKTDNRPEFQKMMKDSAKHLFDVVLVWKLDRFARNRYDSAHNKAILRKNGVKVVSATEPISEDSTGILLESLLEGYAEFFSAELSEKVIRGLTENAHKCKYNGAGVPVGYYIDDEQHYQVNETTAPLVLDAFKMYADERKSVRKIVQILNEKGLVTSYKKPMSINSVTWMLKNRKYIGEYKYRDIIHPNGIPAIVPQELFDRVQERMAKNKKAPARTKAIEDNYLLTTKLFCGKCGAYMIGESGTSHTGKFHQYYKCATAKKRKGCDKKSIRKALIENLVVDETLAMLRDDKIIDYIIDLVMEVQGAENTSLPLFQQQLSETEKGIANMLNAIQAGIFNQSTKQRLDELEQAKAELEVKILQEEIQKPQMTEEYLRFFLHKFRDIDAANQEQRQRLIDVFVNAIFLHDDKIVFTFNYKEGSKTVLLKDIHGSDLMRAGAPNFTKNPLPSIRWKADFWFLYQRRPVRNCVSFPGTIISNSSLARRMLCLRASLSTVLLKPSSARKKSLVITPSPATSVRKPFDTKARPAVPMVCPGRGTRLTPGKSPSSQGKIFAGRDAALSAISSCEA